jgi:predicted nicotinamide N-methyase
VPELQVFYGQSLVEIWEAAEKLAGQVLPAPFWAYPWAAGLALARLILDRPELVRGARVLDFGCGGGVAALAAARAGAAQVVANDLDAWALAIAEMAARRQALTIETLRSDLTKSDGPIPFDVVLCSDLAYEKKVAPQQRVFLERARAQGARVLVADAGRTYFEPAGLEQLAEYTIAVPRDLEGVDVRPRGFPARLRLDHVSVIPSATNSYAQALAGSARPP